VKTHLLKTRVREKKSPPPSKGSEVLLGRDFYAAVRLLVLSMGNFERSVLSSGRTFRNVSIANVPRHFAFNCGQKPIKFASLALGHQLHASIGQIAHKPRYWKALRYSLHSKAEPNALDMARVAYAPAFQVFAIHGSSNNRIARGSGRHNSACSNDFRLSSWRPFRTILRPSIVAGPSDLGGLAYEFAYFKPLLTGPLELPDGRHDWSRWMQRLRVVGNALRGRFAA
jgi:hypothetical protein